MKKKTTIKDVYLGRLRLEAYNHNKANEMWEMLESYSRKYKVDITSDACVGDEVVFIQANFTGSWRNPKFSHYSVVCGKIVNDSYGDRKQQHTFTIQQTNGEKMLIKGRNLYKNGLFAKPRKDSEREVALIEKHERGKIARENRDIRRDEEYHKRHYYDDYEQTIREYRQNNNN